jgi:hypothetical protein
MLGARPTPLKYLVVAVQSRVAVSAVPYGSAIPQSPGLMFPRAQTLRNAGC